MKSISLIIFISCIVIVLKAQDVLFYTSIQGTWDKEKCSTRAQFGGNNQLLYSYFNEFTGLLIAAGEYVNSTGEITFRVNEQGEIDSMYLRKEIGQNYDETVKRIILSMSGKWRPAVNDGFRTSEIITMWVHIYHDRPLLKNLDEYLTASEQYFEENNYKKALNNINQALKYDELNSKGILLKYQILIAQNNITEACSFLNMFKKYQIELLSTVTKSECLN